MLLAVLSPFLTAVPVTADPGPDAKEGSLAVAEAEPNGKADPQTPPYFTRYSTYLCSGYVGCKRAGYSHFGYKKHNHRMWWLMYAGHNCTNYVAYRMVKGGMSSRRPWSGTGMAYNWGRANRNITDDTPMVGAVAWWNRYDNGVGSSGHVAYVEKVVNKRTIVISEDSWSGDFHWRRIVKGSGSWPTGFVHLNDRKVIPRDPPVIEGDPAVGEPLTASTGRWTPDARLELQWLADGKPIAGATDRTYTPTVAMRRARLSVRVEARSRGYVPGKTTSARTARVARGEFRTLTRPELTGTVRVDQTLELRQAAWSPNPEFTSIRWYADGELLEGESTPRLHLGQGLYRKRITAVMTARATGYRTSKVTMPVSVPVRAGHIKISDPFRVGGVLRHGRELSVRPGAVTPADARAAYTWLRDGVPVQGAVGTTYLLGPDDVGSRMSVRVDLALEGYLDKTVTARPGRPGDIVTTMPTLTTKAVGRRGRAVVKLHVAAPGVAHPRGEAVVRIDGQKVVGKVVDGVVRVVVRDLSRGKHDVAVHYRGTDVVHGARSVTTVRVLRK